jgi:hypothetical protein
MNQLSLAERPVLIWKLAVYFVNARVPQLLTEETFFSQ